MSVGYRSRPSTGITVDQTIAWWEAMENSLIQDRKGRDLAAVKTR